MRVFHLALAGLMVAGILAAQPVNKASAARGAAIYNGPKTSVKAWLWSDKYVYSPGENITLRGTVMTNNDRYPYTVFVYMTNNQTGAKSYFPGASSEPVDIMGHTRDQGFQPMQLQDVTGQTVIGSGGLGTVSMPSDSGMYTFTWELRDYTGTNVLKAEYMKVGVVKGQQQLPNSIDSDMTLTNDTQWIISGVVAVHAGATLTVEPGTFMFGLPGSTPPSVLLITKDAKIFAEGTPSRPIIMTSQEAFGERTRGGWGGILMLGNAPVNTAAGISGGNSDGTFYIEGLQTNPDGLFGGNDIHDSCGTLAYVRVENAGSILSPNNETNSFTFGGCGDQSVMHHLQAINGLDDTFEWFGGTMNAHHLMGGLGADDYLDYQLGFTGKVQFIVGYQSPDQLGNRCIEGDNSEYDASAQPYSAPTVFNLTCVGPNQEGYDEGITHGALWRRSTHGSFNNIIFTRFIGGGYHLGSSSNDTTAQEALNNGTVHVNGIMMWANGGDGAPETLAGQLGGDGSLDMQFAQSQYAHDVFVSNPLLNSPLVYADPDFSVDFGSQANRAGAVQPPDDGFFDATAQYIGAMGPGNNWGDEEWLWYVRDQDMAVQ